jgi:hypothetical protein
MSEIGLDVLLRDKGRSLPDDVDSPRDVTESEMSAMLRIRARLLMEVGDELLRGNFQSFPRLMSKAEKELRRREVELFGSKPEELTMNCRGAGPHPLRRSKMVPLLSAPALSLVCQSAALHECPNDPKLRSFDLKLRSDDLKLRWHDLNVEVP